MTCIVGYVEKDKVYIGGDSAGAANLQVRIRSDEKVFKKGKMIFGFTTSFRMGQIIRYSFKIPKHKKGIKDYEYMCSIFIDALIKSFTENNFAKIDNNRITGGTFLIGYKKNLYKVQNDFQVSKLLQPYDVCGIGEQYALGALKVLETLTLQPKEKVKKALITAASLSGAVSEPFHIVEL